MATDITILGIAGSLRKASYNKALLSAAQEMCPQGAAIEIFDLAALPLFNQDEEKNPPQSVRELKSRVRAADGLLIVTPEYNYSMPGVLKNALDWGSRPHGDSAWGGKVAAIMGASVGLFGSARAQYHLRQVFVGLDVECINQPEVMVGSATKCFDDAGHLTDAKSRELIAGLLQNLVRRVGQRNA